MKLTDSQKRQLERNAAYWARREEKALKHYIKDEAEYDKRIKQIYFSMLHSVQSEINSFYGRYADKEGISLAEARKRASKLDIAAYERKAKRYVKDKEFSKQANEEMRLYNATMKINRLEMLKANIGLHLIEGHDELEKFMGEILGDRTVEELERQAGILGKTVRVNAQLAHTIPNASFHHATFSDRVWMNQAMLKNELSSLLQTGMIQGKNPRVLARELEKKFDTSRFNAERLMRTEMARVQTEAQKQSYGRNGVEYFEFITNSGCCDVCKAMNGKVYPVSKLTPGLNAPPLHPHCRCSTAPWVDSKEYEAWVSHLEKGGTTKTWEQAKKSSEDIAISKKGSILKLGKQYFAEKTKHAEERSAERKLPDDAIDDALRNPLHKGEIVVDDFGRKSQKFIGKEVTIIYNPDTDTVVSGWKTGDRIRRRYQKGDKDDV